MVLPPFVVRRVVVALRALGAEAEEQARGPRGDGYHVEFAVRLVVRRDWFAQMGQDKIDRPVLVRPAARGEQAMDHLVPTAVARLELLVQPRLHRAEIGLAGASGQKEVGPEGG